MCYIFIEQFSIRRRWIRQSEASINKKSDK